MIMRPGQMDGLWVWLCTEIWAGDREMLDEITTERDKFVGRFVTFIGG